MHSFFCCPNDSAQFVMLTIPCCSLSSMLSISEQILHEVKHSTAGSASIIAACPSRRNWTKKREDKPTDKGKNLNCQNYLCNIFAENQPTAVKEKHLLLRTRRLSKSLVKRKNGEPSIPCSFGLGRR